MNKLAAPILAALLAVTAPSAYAGGPVIVDDSEEVVADKAGSTIGILPIILITIALCAAVCGGSDDEEEKKIQP